MMPDIVRIALSSGYCVVTSVKAFSIDVGVVDVEEDGVDPRVLGRDPVQQLLAAAADDHLVAECVPAQRQSQPETRSTAGDEDRVPCRFHGSSVRSDRHGATRLGSATARPSSG